MHPQRSLGERGAHKKIKQPIQKQNWIVLRRPVIMWCELHWVRKPAYFLEIGWTPASQH
jgi:hypothetical protein